MIFCVFDRDFSLYLTCVISVCISLCIRQCDFNVFLTLCDFSMCLTVFDFSVCFTVPESASRCANPVVATNAYCWRDGWSSSSESESVLAAILAVLIVPLKD